MAYTGYPPNTATFPFQVFTVTANGIANYVLNYPAASSTSILVTVNGLHRYTDTYGASGTALQFLAPLPVINDRVEIIWLGQPTITENVQSFTSIAISTTLNGLDVVPSSAIPPTANFVLGAKSGNVGLNIPSGGTGASSFVANALVYGPDPVQPPSPAPPNPLRSLGLGTSGQLLASQGTGNPPTWTSSFVQSWSGGTTGLAPGTATNGVVTLSGTLNVANGGTGVTTFPTRGILLANGASPFSTITGSANNGDVVAFTAGQPQFQDGRRISAISTVAGLGLTFASSPSGPVAGSTPSPLSNQITVGGTLSVANGGTGVTTLALNQVLLGNGTNAVNTVGSLGTTGQVLTSAGAGNPPTWTTIPDASWTDATLLPIGAIIMAFYQNGSGGALNPPVPGNVVVLSASAVLVSGVTGSQSTITSGSFRYLGGPALNTGISLWSRSA